MMIWETIRAEMLKNRRVDIHLILNSFACRGYRLILLSNMFYSDSPQRMLKVLVCYLMTLCTAL